MSKLYVKSRSHSRSTSIVSLPFLTEAPIRVAQLGETLPLLGNLRPLLPESVIHLQSFRPNMIAGTCLELRRLAEELGLGTIDLSSVDHAIVVLTRCRENPLSDVDRVVFWQTFGVPVFEMFVSFDNSIWGYECELHEGWHLAPHVWLSDADGELILEAPGVKGLHTALSGWLTHDRCPCGRPGARLLNIESFEQLAIQPMAAIA